MMQQLQTGQCGVCVHFGEHHVSDEQLVQIRSTKQAPLDYVDACGKNENISLKVSALSGCNGFEPAGNA